MDYSSRPFAGNMGLSSPVLTALDQVKSPLEDQITEKIPIESSYVDLSF